MKEAINLLDDACGIIANSNLSDEDKERLLDDIGDIQNKIEDLND